MRLSAHARRPFVFVAALLMLLLAPCAAAQDGPYDDAGPFSIPFTKRAITTACTTLGFDADQAASARALYDGYRAAFSSLTTKANRAATEQQEKAANDADYSAYAKEQAKRTETYVDAVQALEVGLMSDLRSLCTPAQLERFPIVERSRRRDVGLRMALISAEQLDILSILEAIRVDPQTGPLADAVAR